MLKFTRISGRISACTPVCDLRANEGMDLAMTITAECRVKGPIIHWRLFIVKKLTWISFAGELISAAKESEPSRDEG